MQTSMSFTACSWTKRIGGYGLNGDLKSLPRNAVKNIIFWIHVGHSEIQFSRKENLKQTKQQLTPQQQEKSIINDTSFHRTSVRQIVHQITTDFWFEQIGHLNSVLIQHFWVSTKHNISQAFQVSLRQNFNAFPTLKGHSYTAPWGLA